MCWAGKVLVHHPHGVATNLSVGVVRQVQILVGDGVITISIEHWIPPLTIFGGPVLQRVDSVGCLAHNHQLTDRRIDIWIVDRTVGLSTPLQADLEYGSQSGIQQTSAQTLK